MKKKLQVERNTSNSILAVMKRQGNTLTMNDNGRGAVLGDFIIFSIDGVFCDTQLKSLHK